MRAKDPRVDAYIAGAAEFAKPILRHLRKLVHTACPEVEETLKWRCPAFLHKELLWTRVAKESHVFLCDDRLRGGAPTEKWFCKARLATGKKLDMGKCCVRFKNLEEVPLDIVGELFGRVPVEEYVTLIERMASRATRKSRKS